MASQIDTTHICQQGDVNGLVSNHWNPKARKPTISSAMCWQVWAKGSFFVCVLCALLCFFFATLNLILHQNLWPKPHTTVICYGWLIVSTISYHWFLTKLPSRSSPSSRTAAKAATGFWSIFRTWCSGAALRKSHTPGAQSVPIGGKIVPCNSGNLDF